MRSELNEAVESETTLRQAVSHYKVLQLKYAVDTPHDNYCIDDNGQSAYQQNTDKCKHRWMYFAYFLCCSSVKGILF